MIQLAGLDLELDTPKPEKPTKFPYRIGRIYDIEWQLIRVIGCLRLLVWVYKIRNEQIPIRTQVTVRRSIPHLTQNKPSSVSLTVRSFALSPFRFSLHHTDDDVMMCLLPDYGETAATLLTIRVSLPCWLTGDSRESIPTIPLLNHRSLQKTYCAWC